VTNNGDSVTYDPNGQFQSLADGETATDTFSYTISDGKGGTSTATVTVTIHGQTDLPPPEGQAEGEAIPVAFAISAADRQVYYRTLDASGNPTSAWTYTAPGYFLSLAAGEFGPDHAPIVFGVGYNHQVYYLRLNPDGTFRDGWTQVGPGCFDSLAVAKYGADGAPVLFGVATDVGDGAAHRVFAAKFDAQGNVISGWSQVSGGLFRGIVGGIAAGDFGVGQINPELFGIGQDGQVYAARFNADATLASDFALVAPGQFTQLTVGNHSDGTLQLFGLGVDHHAYAAQFDNVGIPAGGWSQTAPGLFSAIAAAPLGSGDFGGISLGVGVAYGGSARPLQEHQNSQTYVLTFQSSGVADEGWTKLTQGLFSAVGASSQGLTSLYGVSFINGDVDNPSDNINQGFFSDAPGIFSDIKLAV